jgi:tetratricopeptide (TPR) repeat protein
MDWESRIADLWSRFDAIEPADFVARVDRLAAELPEGSAIARFERACALDSTGNTALAVPLYREALDIGLEGISRRRAVIQMASSMRSLGRAAEAVVMLEAERAAASDELDDAVSAVLALTLADLGREREAVSIAVAALAAHLPRYQRSMRNYALALLAE